MSKLVKFLKFIICFTIITFIVIEIMVISFAVKSKPERSDCIIVLGCRVYGKTPSPFLVWRMEEGIRLYKEHYGKKIIVSGGKGEGEEISEAEAMKIYMTSKGIPETDIIMEDKSSSTRANLINSKRIMDNNNFKDALIVSNKYHLKRAALIAREQGIKGSYSGVFVKPHKSHEIVGFIREVPAMIKHYLIKIFLD